MSDLNQQLLNFNQNQNFNYDDFYVSKSNYYAFKLIETWPKWEKNIVNIYGEKYSGKSHLAEIFRQKYKALKFTENQLNNKFFKSLKLHENLILENYENKTDEKLMYSLFNLVDQDNKYLIINSNIPLIKMNFKLSDLSSRAKNCILAEIKDPDDDLIYFWCKTLDCLLQLPPTVLSHTKSFEEKTCGVGEKGTIYKYQVDDGSRQD